MLAFTMEEAWLNRFPGEDGFGASPAVPGDPDATGATTALAEKWRKVRQVRRVVTGALEIERKEGRIGSSLEAAPKVYIADSDLRAALAGVDLAEIAITSGVELLAGRRARRTPSASTRCRALPWCSRRAKGTKCARSWKILRRRRRRPRVSRAHPARCRGRPAVRRPPSRRARSRAPHATLVLGTVVAARARRRRADAVLVDQAHKAWMLYVYDIAAKGIVTITSFFDLVLVWNRGISYGLFPQESAPWPLGLILFAFGASSRACRLARAGRSRSSPPSAIGLIIGGAIGNAIDRILYGAVADFFSFHAFGFNGTCSISPTSPSLPGWWDFCMNSLFGGHKKVGNPSKM